MGQPLEHLLHFYLFCFFLLLHVLKILDPLLQNIFLGEVLARNLLPELVRQGGFPHFYELPLLFVDFQFVFVQLGQFPVIELEPGEVLVQLCENDLAPQELFPLRI